MAIFSRQVRISQLSPGHNWKKCHVQRLLILPHQRLPGQRSLGCLLQHHCLEDVRPRPNGDFFLGLEKTLCASPWARPDDQVHFQIPKTETESASFPISGIKFPFCLLQTPDMMWAVERRQLIPLSHQCHNLQVQGPSVHIESWGCSQSVSKLVRVPAEPGGVSEPHQVLI